MCAELKVSQVWRQRGRQDDLVGRGWALRGGNKQARCPRSGFNLGSDTGAQVQGEVLGSPGGSTPCDLGWVLQIGSWHTPGGLPHLLLGRGQQVGPTYRQPGQRVELAQLGEMAIVKALLSGKSLYHTVPSWEWERKEPGRHEAKGLPPGVCV